MTPKYDARRALELLRTGVGDGDADFREGQEQAIRNVVEGRGRLLVVQKTGWGKSFVYFISTKLLREAGRGPALLVSPLLSLMRNQIDAATRMGVRACRIASDNEPDWSDVERGVQQDDIDILLVAPERLRNERFRTRVLEPAAHRVSLLVVDEAHCMSDWGHDFRPDYRRIETFVRTLPPNVRVLATTATANRRVTEDIRDILGTDVEVSRGDLNRPSLVLQTIDLPDKAERLAWLAEQIPRLFGHGIVYTLTVRDAEQVADWLRSRGLTAAAYTGRMDNDQRQALEADLLDNRVKVLVATVALGMGFDKPDLGFVVHYQMPGSAVAYYQQVGRAGRALDAAYGILLSGKEDITITNYFIENAFPARDEVDQVLAALEDARDGLSESELTAQVNLGRNRILKAVELLSLESPSPVVRDGRKWCRTAARLSPTFWERTERLTDLRGQERRQMQEYVALRSGHMAFLVRALDGEPNAAQEAELPPLPTSPDPALRKEADAFLKNRPLPIKPRKQWPAGASRSHLDPKPIEAEYRAEEGRALCVWQDGGHGDLVERGKYEDGRYDEELVQACVAMIRRWNPEPPSEWVACIPSQRSAGALADFAKRLATSLQLPFKEVFARKGDRPEQKTMANTAHKVRNVIGAFDVAEPPMPGAVLLVDDVVDSGWTLTVAAGLLRKNGSGPVRPCALAKLRA